MRLKNYGLLVFLLGLGHGLNDMIAGYFLGSLVQSKLTLLQTGTALLVYNLLAFGGQYPVALLLEEIRQPKKFLLIAYGLNIAAVPLFVLAAQFSIVLAGIGSALYHVAGGTVCAEKNRSAHIGLFAAPGVGGLILGSYLAFEKIAVSGWLLGAASLFFIIIYSFPFVRKKVAGSGEITPGAGHKSGLDRHDLIMILLLTVMSLRSAIWDVFQFIHENNYRWLIAIAAAAFFGKLAGGWLADRIGLRLYAISSLTLATPLIHFFRNEILLFCIGIGLLQSGIPATTSLLIQSMKGKKERAVGLSFGTAIVAGAFAFYTPLRGLLMSHYFEWITVTCMLMLLLLFFTTRQKGRLLS